MKIYAMTKKGNFKCENEDRILISDSIISEGYYEFTAESAVIAIADGVGGNNAGAVASSFVCDYLSITENINKQLLENINIELIEKSKVNASLNKMATTLSGIRILNGNTKLFHIGNTRISIMQGKYLKQITEDHTTVNWLVRIRKLTTTEAEDFNKRNEITSCLGGGDSSLISQMVFIESCDEIENANRIIITSDGIHEYVSIDELEDLLNNSISMKETCHQIIKKAEQNGSLDDQSVVVIESEVK